NAVLLEVTDTGPLAVLTACTDYVARPLEPEATAAAFEASQLALQLEVAKQYPDFQLGPGLLFKQGEYKWMLGLTLTLPILNQNEGPIAEAEARRREAAVRFEALQARIIGEVERTAAGARGALDKFRAAEEMLETRKRQEQDTEALVNAGESDRLAPVAGRVATRTSDLARFDALIRAQQVIAQLEDALQRSLEDNRADLPIPAGTLQLELGNR
ncbi:MAG: TolC family protein, partial [Gammaproteobacteria bacterium]